MATAATVSPTPTAEPRKPAQGLREARAGMTKRRTRRTKIAALLSASALVVLDAACPLYVLGGSGERREARRARPKKSFRIGSPKTSLMLISTRSGVTGSDGWPEAPRSIGR